MGNFNINVDRPKLTTEEIAAKQNFDAVLSKYKQATIPVYKKPWFWGAGGLASIGLATIVSLNLINGQTENKEVKTQVATELPPDTECIKPPVKGENVPFNTYQVNPQKDEKIVLTSGTTVTIPKGSLEPANANEKVDIQIREFRDKASAFVAGIPMDYEKDKAFESAGMIEIRGTQDKQVVTINEDKPIKIDLVPTQDPSQFAFWKLNEDKKDWENYPVTLTSKSEVKPTALNPKELKIQEQNLKNEIATTKQEIVKVEQEIKNLATPTKEEYKLPDLSHQRFDLAFDKKEYPELAKFENLVFEVVPASGYDKSFTKKNWSEVELLKEKSKYQMLFKKADENFKIEVRPVVEGKELKVAEKNFDEAMIDYKTTKSKLETEKNIFLKAQVENEKRLAELLDKAMEVPVQEALNSNNNTIQKSLNESNNLLTYSNTLSFQTTKWGVFNCDRPISYPEPSSDEIAFLWKGSHTAKFRQIVVFNLVKNNRYVYGTYMQPISNFGVHRKDDLVIIGIDYDGNLGYVELKNRSSQESITRLEFNKKEKSENSLDLLKKLLNETTNVS